MNQNINLYQPIFRRQQKVFSAETMLIMMAILIVGLALITAWGQWRQASLGEQVERLEAEEAQALERLSSLQDTLPAREPSAALRRAVESSEAEREVKRRALSVLENGALGQREGFSEYLLGLGRQRIEPVWLTRIRLDEGGGQIALRGRTQRASQVPVYLQRLSDEPRFAGTDFRTMRIDRAELDDGSSILEFRLSTRADRNGGDD